MVKDNHFNGSASLVEKEYYYFFRPSERPIDFLLFHKNESAFQGILVIAKYFLKVIMEFRIKERDFTV